MVNLSVRLSVTLVDCPHGSTYDHGFFTVAYGSPMILVLEISGYFQNSKGVTPSEGVE